MDPLLLPALGFVLLVVQRIVAFWKSLRSIGHHAGPRRALTSYGIWGSDILPPIPGVAAGHNHLLLDKFRQYARYGWDAYAEVSWFGKSTVVYVLADAAAIKVRAIEEVAASRTRFPKPTEHYEVLAIYGQNILTVEGDTWKKYKKLVSPAFADRSNRLVWSETVRILSDLFEDVWGDRKSIEIDHCLELTMPITLYVLGGAGFGSRMTWKEDTVRPGHQLSFKEATHSVSKNLMFNIAVPKWALPLTKRGRDTQMAFAELGLYMNEMLQERLSSPNSDRDDLFSLLLASSTGDFKDDSEKLTHTEILGNTFIFLIAGHETTAHTLCFAFALLALYPDEQEKLYKHIKSVLTDDEPPVTGIPKYSAEDTTLEIGNQNGETKTIPIPKGTYLTIDAVGLHHNPRYWKNPEEFRPERFLGDWPRDAFVPFSVGARACIGRKFAETEAVAVITMLVSKYKITIKEEPEFASETFEQRKERILKNYSGVTVT
ncbi:614/534 cytochrome P450 [Coprinopsis cinerea okayama7|uniref:614/534 cytochrome P450 n=1 Tax=Coprinopsis cinerea (strain Okayama-7 / 130 / ATCC MYA-4618 / FGSC 9003) TaxID=240176 RepID=D6RP50_COPC7|nr:614/534 cytochrome P450 [Coprinopsis cinerea okayama7\|eukprot:XP_002910625.1 614/534 cytochrome P450 [Coprinopsis cinerea okayama7\